MNFWPVQEAKARFSELLDTCIKEGPQMVTRRGTVAAVLVPIGDWNRMNSTARPSLKELLLTDEYRDELNLPKRGTAKRRTPVKLCG
jgi:antitoxin Phd